VSWEQASGPWRRGRRGCAERAPESRGEGRGVEVRVGEMLRKPRLMSDAANLAGHLHVRDASSLHTNHEEKRDGTAGIEVA
jgi:hypothetical protein